MRIALVGPGLLALALLAVSPAFAQDGSDPIGNLIDERPPVLARNAGAPGDFGWYLSALRAKSCPPGSIAVEGDSVVLKTSPVALQAVNPARKSIGALRFVAGFHLTSPDARFGGLSGLDLPAREFPLPCVLLAGRALRQQHAPPSIFKNGGDHAHAPFPLPRQASWPWHCLNFLPEPQGQGSLRPTLGRFAASAAMACACSASSSTP